LGDVHRSISQCIIEFDFCNFNGDIMIIKPKQSNYKTPRLERNGSFEWAAGAKPYPAPDYFVAVMLCVASFVAGAVVGVVI